MPGIRTVQSSGFQHSAKGTWQLSALLLTEVTLGHRRKVTTQMLEFACEKTAWPWHHSLLSAELKTTLSCPVFWNALESQL